METFTEKVALQPGKDTSEYRIAKGAGTVEMILGIVIVVAGSLVEALGMGGDTTTAIIAGAVVAVCGIALKTLTRLGYIRSRGGVKEMAMQMEADQRTTDADIVTRVAALEKRTWIAKE